VLFFDKFNFVEKCPDSEKPQGVECIDGEVDS
jgi:hypothetical protein